MDKKIFQTFRPNGFGRVPGDFVTSRFQQQWTQGGSDFLLRKWAATE
jgi:hypothetical protein